MAPREPLRKWLSGCHSRMVAWVGAIREWHPGSHFDPLMVSIDFWVPLLNGTQKKVRILKGFNSSLEAIKAPRQSVRSIDSWVPFLSGTQEVSLNSERIQLIPGCG